MLAYTQGLLPTDNYEFLADFQPVSNLAFITKITGLTKAQISSHNLSIESPLRYELEPGNSFDNKAVKIYTENQYLGHVKKIHSKVFHNAKQKLNISVHNIEKNGVLRRVFIKVTV